MITDELSQQFVVCALILAMVVWALCRIHDSLLRRDIKDILSVLVAELKKRKE